MADKKNSKRGWHGDPQGHAMAGRKGGNITSITYGAEFYKEMGRKGGKASSGKFVEGSERAREAGRKGGKKSRKKKAM